MLVARREHLVGFGLSVGVGGEGMALPGCGLLVRAAVAQQGSLCSRYMTISDEWDIPEKQPFKDLVCFTKCLPL